MTEELRIHHSREEEGEFDPPCYSWCQWLHDGCEQGIEQYSFCKECVKEALEIYNNDMRRCSLCQ